MKRSFIKLDLTMWNVPSFLLSFLFLTFGGLSSSGWMDKVDKQLLSAFQFSDQQDFIVLLEKQAKVDYAYQLKNKRDKNRYVFEKLYYTAQQSQKGLQNFLNKKGIPFSSIYIYNAIHTKGDLQLLTQIAKRAEVKAIYANPEVQLELPRPIPNHLTARSDELEWNLSQINTDQVWEMGVRGEGVIVGGQDTGYEWDHPSLIKQYRGFSNDTVDHNYNWYDAIHAISPLSPDSINPCGLNQLTPCDDNDHGTHTMGIMVGDDGGENRIGVAPAAKWIGVRNMERGYGSPFSYTEAFQWFLAPTDVYGLNPNPDMAPHVITNSWYCPELEGCNASNRALIEIAVGNLRAAGIMVVVSAGNSGNECNTINEIPAEFQSAFAVAANNIEERIAGFSARGPVYDRDSNLVVKPDLSAPGVNVRSATRDSNYKNFSGTSMAGPHVSGVVALMISANPSLAGQVDTIENILKRTARPTFSEQDCDALLGMEHPNAVFGYGILDAKAAVDAALLVTSTTRQDLIVEELEVFPNPSKDRVFIRIPDDLVGGTLTMFDINGQLYQKNTLKKKRSIFSADISQLARGVYILKVEADRKLYQSRLVVQ